MVENKPGAGGASGRPRRQVRPDGYNLVIGQTSNLAVNPTLYPDLPYDPQKDLAPISPWPTPRWSWWFPPTRPSKPWRRDQRRQGQAGGRHLRIARQRNISHLSGDLQKAANVKFQHIPYKGASQALTDLMGGQVQTYMSSIPTALAQIKGGKLRALAVTSTKRVPDLARGADSRGVRLPGVRGRAPGSASW